MREITDAMDGLAGEERLDTLLEKRLKEVGVEIWELTTIIYHNSTTKPQRRGGTEEGTEDCNILNLRVSVSPRLNHWWKVMRVSGKLLFLSSLCRLEKIREHHC